MFYLGLVGFFAWCIWTYLEWHKGVTPKRIFKRRSSRIPLVDFCKKAHSMGWNWEDNSEKVINFFKLLRDAGTTGDIQFWEERKRENTYP